MKFIAQALSEAEQEAVHQQSLRILGEAGVCFHGKRALPILERHGAKVNWDTRVVHIPAELVIQALEMVPKSLTLGARNPKYDYSMPSPASHFCIDGTGAFAQDFMSGERRYGTLKDIENALRIFQEMDLGVMAWAPTCANDAPSASRPLHEFFAMIKHCSKHGEHELHTAAQVPYLVEGLLAVLGSEMALKTRKNYSLVYCPVAPLTHEGEMLDAYLELGEWELPIMTLPMPVAGSTGPASLFSNICVANAENLSSLVIYQLANPGRAIMYSSATGSLNFHSGTYLGGTPEMGLMSAALTCMGRYYGLPSCAAGCTADAKGPGAEAVMQKLITTITPFQQEADIVIGTGEVESDQLLVLEQIVVDNEIGHICRRITRGVDCSPEKDLVEDVLQVGPGGYFLKARSTRTASRSDEFYMSDLAYYGNNEAWLAAGKPDIYATARKKVEEILSAPLVDPLPEETSAKLDEILHRADQEL